MAKNGFYAIVVKKSPTEFEKSCGVDVVSHEFDLDNPRDINQFDEIYESAHLIASALKPICVDENHFRKVYFSRDCKALQKFYQGIAA